jgi:NAD(P)-dependent dehydrogenase (short-subunit alcohol dehydrogenase family)
MSTRYVLITGASKGIGKATALHLDKQGFHVFAGVRKVVDAEMLQKEASEHLQTLYIDVTNSEQIAAAGEQIAEIVGEMGLYGLVNNAGMAEPNALEFIELDDLRYQLEVNLIGQLAITQTMMPLIRKARGRIINISSISGRVAQALVGAYNISKFAMEAMTDVLRLELAPWGIEVVSIEPGMIDTPIWDTALARADEVIEKLPKEALKLYGKAIEATKERVIQQKEKAISPQVVADTIERALIAKRPKTRYLVGPDAQLAGRLRVILPDRWLDKLLTRM